jgi:hypothetical protein
MRKILLVFLGLMLTSHSAFSNTSEIQEKQKIFNMMKTYTSLVACMTSFENDPENSNPTTIKDVHTVEYNLKDRSFVFYILWGGDMGCAGGSGTLSGYVTEVAKYGGDWKPYTIQSDYAFGQNIGLNYKYIESIKKIDSNTFEVISWDYADSKYGGEDGGSNFPANKFRYKLERERFEPWKITHQSLLEQRK